MTITDSIVGTLSKISDFSVVHGVTSQFIVSSSASSSTAGASFNVTVTAKDQFNNTATGYTGTVHFTSSDVLVSAGSGLPTNYTFLVGDDGQRTFTGVILKTAGSKTVTVADTGAGTINGTSSSVSVSPSTMHHFGVSPPATVTAGTAFVFTVTSQDQFNNTVPSYAGTVQISTSDSQNSGSNPATLTNGSGLFAITLKTAGSQTLTASDASNANLNGTSGSFNVVAGAVHHFGISAPATATAGTAIDVTVTAFDAYNNTATGYAGTVQLTSSDSQASLPGNYHFVSDDNGRHTFSVTLKTVGGKTITVTDTVQTVLTISTSNISVGHGAATHFSVSMQSSAVAGSTVNVTVTALDAYNNTATGYMGTVQFTSSDSQASLPGNYQFVSGDNGRHTFSVTV